MPKIVSDSQRRFFGAVASGSIKGDGLTKSSAKKTLEENKGSMKNLPEKVSRKK